MNYLQSNNLQRKRKKKPTHLITRKSEREREGKHRMKQDRGEVNKKKKIQKNRKINGKIKKSNDRGPFQQTKHASSSSTHTQTDRQKKTQ